MNEKKNCTRQILLAKFPLMLMKRKGYLVSFDIEDLCRILAALHLQQEGEERGQPAPHGHQDTQPLLPLCNQ